MSFRVGHKISKRKKKNNLVIREKFKVKKKIQSRILMKDRFRTNYHYRRRKDKNNGRRSTETRIS